MSICNKLSTPVRILRGFFFLIILVFSITYFSQTKSYAEEERETKNYVVVQEERIEKPKVVVIRKIEEDMWGSKEVWLLISLIVILAGIFAFILLFLMYTIGIYVEDMDGNMKYIRRQWITHKEEFFEVKISMELLEKCTTTHFLLRPSMLFASLYQKKSIACLFPEDICIIKEIERNIEISLL